ncbi:MAG TPA: DUF1360 domain-containing protein [Pseudonocardiaceae bacterium]|jgi:hypothetical protein|nr:DUF1360 domain-containing protein [Pseudonocardiaceae bacterium]
MRNLAPDVTRTAQADGEEYRNGEERPMGGYVVAMGAFVLLVALAALVATLAGRNLPRRIGAYDLLLITAGTHKLSRTLSKAAVTSPLRAPFTRYQDTAGPGELKEEVRQSTGLRHAIGELLTCPFCLDMWVVTAHMIGLIFVPRFTRLTAATFAALAGADFLHLAYTRATQATEN